MSEHNVSEISETIMTPELLAEEARLSCLKLRAFPAAQLKTVLQIRSILRRNSGGTYRQLDSESMETIASLGKSCVVIPQRRYVRAVRARSFLTGSLLGFFVGALFVFWAALNDANFVDLKITPRVAKATVFCRFSDKDAELLFFDSSNKTEATEPR